MPTRFPYTTLFRSRGNDAHPYQLVSAAVSLEPREPFPSKAERGVGLDPRRNPKAGRALHRGHLDLGAERGIREGDGQLEDEVIPVPDEPMVGSDMDGDVEVTGRSARVPREAAAGDSKLDAVRHAFRDLDRNRPPLLDPTLTGASRARAFRPLLPAVASLARRERAA